MNVVFISSKYPVPARLASANGNEEEIRKSRDFSQGGVATHVARLSQALALQGCDVTVFAYSAGIDRVERDGRVTVCWLSLPQDLGQMGPLEQPALRSLEQRFLSRVQELILRPGRGPDVIHCHHAAGFQAACMLRQMIGVPVVSSIHFLLFSRHKVDQGEFPESMREAEKAMCDGSDRLIAVSHWMKQSVVETVQIDPKKVTVVHNGFRAGRRINYRRDLQLRIEYAPRGEKIILYAGRIGRDKGVPPLLDSARRVLEKARGVVYIIAGGSSEELRPLQEQIGNCETLKGRVHCTGWLTQLELRRLYGIADMAIVPSIYEPFGFAALEAMAASVPVIASDAGGLPEIITHNQSGWIVPLNGDSGRAEVDIEGLTQAQLRMLNDEELTRRLAFHGRERALKYFTVGKMRRKTLEVYRQAMRSLGDIAEPNPGT
jgi:glycosyltransferase involved in cell wall biosynthesis